MNFFNEMPKAWALFALFLICSCSKEQLHQTLPFISTTTAPEKSKERRIVPQIYKNALHFETFDDMNAYITQCFEQLNTEAGTMEIIAGFSSLLAIKSKAELAYWEAETELEERRIIKEYSRLLDFEDGHVYTKMMKDRSILEAVLNEQGIAYVGRSLYAPKVDADIWIKDGDLSKIDVAHKLTESDEGLGIEITPIKPTISLPPSPVDHCDCSCTVPHNLPFKKEKYYESCPSRRAARVDFEYLHTASSTFSSGGQIKIKYTYHIHTRGWAYKFRQSGCRKKVPYKTNHRLVTNCTLIPWSGHPTCEGKENHYNVRTQENWYHTTWKKHWSKTFPVNMNAEDAYWVCELNNNYTHTGLNGQIVSNTCP